MAGVAKPGVITPVPASDTYREVANQASSLYGTDQQPSSGGTKKGEKKMGVRRVEILICDSHDEEATAENIGGKKCGGTAVRKYELWIDAYEKVTGTEENEAGDKVEIKETIPGHFEDQAHCDKAMKPYLDFMASVRGKGETVVPDQFKQEEPTGQQAIPGTSKPRPSSGNGYTNAQKDEATAALRTWCRKMGWQVSDRGRVKEDYRVAFLNSDEGKPYAHILKG